jgi:pimeloyl-ACP methyl ester carboxylesterase
MAPGADVLALSAAHFLDGQRPWGQRPAWHHDVTHSDRLYATWPPKHRLAPAVPADITPAAKAPGAIDGALVGSWSFLRKTADGALAKRTIWARALVPAAPAARAAKAVYVARACPTFAGRYDFVDLNGAGHFPQLEEPAKVADAILAFPGEAALVTKRAREDARTDKGRRHHG